MLLIRLVAQSLNKRIGVVVIKSVKKMKHKAIKTIKYPHHYIH